MCLFQEKAKKKKKILLFMLFYSPIIFPTHVTCMLIYIYIFLIDHCIFFHLVIVLIIFIYIIKLVELIELMK